MEQSTVAQASPEQTVVLLGNTNPHMQMPIFDQKTGVQIGNRGYPAPHLNQSETRAEMRPGFDDREHVELSLSTDNDDVLSLIGRTLVDEHRIYAVGIAELRQVVAVHAGGAKPAWVESSDQAFARAIAAFYGCPVGRPTALLTTAGRDALHQQHMNVTQPAPFNYMALTASTTTPLASDTTLAGEITTAGGGLVRGLATIAHTIGTNTSTATKTFTANGSDVLPVTVAQIGIFNGTGAVTMAYHTALSSSATLSVAGDNVTVTETVNGG